MGNKSSASVRISKHHQKGSIPSKKKVLLADPNTKYPIPLIEKEILSPDTRRFRFGLPTPEHVLGIYTGGHLLLVATIEGDLVMRAYTPVSNDDDTGYVDLVIKIYFKNVHPKFPEGGKMSQYLDNLKIGDTIDCKGPIGKMEYPGNGVFLLKQRPSDTNPAQKIVKKVNMVAGGSGITPMLQLARHILSDPSDKTEMRLLYANRSEKDILLRDTLDRYQKENPDRIKIWYTIDNPPPDWAYSTGHLNEDMFKKHLFPPSDGVFIYMCGPPSMIDVACKPAFEKLGYRADLQFP